MTVWNVSVGSAPPCIYSIFCACSCVQSQLSTCIVFWTCSLSQVVTQLHVIRIVPGVNLVQNNDYNEILSDFSPYNQLKSGKMSSVRATPASVQILPRSWLAAVLLNTASSDKMSAYVESRLTTKWLSVLLFWWFGSVISLQVYKRIIYSSSYKKFFRFFQIRVPNFFYCLCLASFFIDTVTVTVTVTVIVPSPSLSHTTFVIHMQ
jgi:hypothetical protein